MDMLKRDRFELLSAYLDGEVTAAERRQVEEWLVNDPATQRLYGRLLTLRQGLRNIPVPSAEQPVEQTIQRVFARLGQRAKRTMAWGGAAIAAVFIGTLSTNVLSGYQGSISENFRPAPVAAEPLMVALNTPVIEIPKAPVAAPQTATQASDAFHQPN